MLDRLGNSGCTEVLVRNRMPIKATHENVWDDQLQQQTNQATLTEKWVCERCGEGGFDSYEECYQHEQLCGKTVASEALNAAVAVAVATETGGNWNLLASASDRNTLSELDYLLCRNIEVFRASDEDVNDSTYVEGSCGNATVVGQAGFRCIHCSHSPLATAGYATVFPASIIHIGASLRMMAEWHFPRCGMTPNNVREAISRALALMKKSKEFEEEEHLRLKDFCVGVIAKRLNLSNMIPAKTGIIFSKRDSERKKSPPPQPQPQPQALQTQPQPQPPPLQPQYRHAEQRWYSPEDVSSYYAQQYGSSPSGRHNASPTGLRPPPPPLPQPPRIMYQPNIPLPQPPHPPMDRRMMYQPNFAARYDYSHSFYRESMGWACRHCSTVPVQFRAPNSFYPHPTPPSPSFIEYHLQHCTGNMFYQPPTQYPAYPEPNNSSREAYALEYLASVTGYDSPLVMDEDKVLLSDYFFYLIKQLQFCRFAESDRKTRGGKRENVKVGFGGLECRHCHRANPASSRKFFWSNVDRLANSFAEIPSHLLKCKNCPERIKNSLHILKLKHPEQMAKLPRGSQKVFFRRMWRRVHMDSSEKADEEEDTPTFSSSGSSAPKPSATSGIPLAIPEDKDWLSDTDCFVRRNLEVFCATEEDVFSAQSDRKFPIHLGQVGIRCIHCVAATAARGNAVNFPYSIDGIYEVVRELQKLHLESCPNLPEEVKQEMTNLKTSTSLSSVLRRYYVLAAKALGMIDTSEGIRMGGETLAIATTGDLSVKPDAEEPTFDDIRNSYSEDANTDSQHTFPPNTYAALSQDLQINPSLKTESQPISNTLKRKSDYDHKESIKRPSYDEDSNKKSSFNDNVITRAKLDDNSYINRRSNYENRNSDERGFYEDRSNEKESKKRRISEDQESNKRRSYDGRSNFRDSSS